MKNRILLIINPEASKGQGRKKAKAIDTYFKKQGILYTPVYTTDCGHAEFLANKGAKDGYDTIVAVGGDGTVNEVINGIMQSGLQNQVKMGIIPVGRGNDFAWVCNIPNNVKKACDLIVRGEGKPTDVGLCIGPEKPNGMYFLNGAGFGFEPLVNFCAMEYKHINGMPSYVAAFLKILRRPPLGYNIKLTIDGKKQELATQQISVANGIRMGSAFKMTPLAKIDDGKLDIMFTTKVFKGTTLIKLVYEFLQGKHVRDSSSFAYLNAKSVEIECEKPELPVHLDGELYSKNAQKVSLKILPGVINLLR